MRAFLTLVFCFLATQSAAELLSLRSISAYLNELSTAKGSFTQVTSDGDISTGTLYIRRPGRVRFEYDPPSKALVIAGGGQVAVYDPKSNVPPEQYPLKRTPLNLILAKDIDLSRAQMVVDHREDGPSTIVTAQDPEHPEYGTIELVFTGSPVELRKWVITDDGGTKTEVVLGGLETGVRLRAGLFNIRQETSRRIKN